MRWVAISLAISGLCAALMSVWLPAWHPELELAVELPDDSSSNIERKDYVGPEVCADCHEEKREHWGRHLHRTMNALAGPETVVGDFAGASLRYGGGEASFLYSEGTYWMLLRAGDVRRRFRVTRTIGSEFIQEYVGVQTDGPEPAGDPVYSTQIRLPFGYWRRPGAWFHQQYYDSWFGPEYRDGELAVDPYQPELDSWRGRCTWCHNTYAFDLRLWRSQGPLRRGHGIEQHFALGGHASPTHELAAKKAVLPLDELVTIGISCESCHLGGREHAFEEREMRFGPVHPNLQRLAGEWVQGGREEPKVITTLCAQCHSAPSPRYPTGAARRNSSEALDLGASACASAATCTDCHDPHVRGAVAEDQPRQVEACQSCHTSLATAQAAEAHGRHRIGDANCLDCHMPRIVQGFSTVIRTHRIGRALEPSMVAEDQPNACNICHLDRSTSWAARQVQLYWNQSVKAVQDRPAGAAWLSSDDPHIVVTAAAAYARSPLGRKALPTLIEKLDQPVAYYRMRMLFAVEEILGRRLAPNEYSPTAAPEVRRAQIRKLSRRWRRP